MVEAIDSLNGVADAMDRAKALTELLDGWPDHHSRIRAMRQQAFKSLVEGGMTYRQIAVEFNISPARVGQIVGGVTNPRTQKNPPPKEPRRKPGASADPPAE